MVQPKEIVVDTSVLFAAAYKQTSTTKKLLELIKSSLKIKLYSPDFVKAEFKEKLLEKLGLLEEEADILIEELPIVWIEKHKYEELLEEAKRFIKDEEDSPILACSLYLNKLPIWTFDEKHFNVPEIKELGIEIYDNADIAALLVD